MKKSFKLSCLYTKKSSAKTPNLTILKLKISWRSQCYPILTQKSMLVLGGFI